MKTTDIVILAAGKGTRMNTDLPKVLVELSGKPLISHLLETINGVCHNKPVIVVGYEKEKVTNTLGSQFKYAIQEEQNGTAHAVASALPHISSENILVLYGDMPFITNKTILNIVNSHESSKAPLTLATTVVPNFSDWHSNFERFGRIVRNNKGEISHIKEYKDATDEEKEIKEVNPAYFMFNTNWLKENIDNINKENSQGELYLTDLVKIAKERNESINSISIDPREALGANTVEELAVLEKMLLI